MRQAAQSPSIEIVGQAEVDRVKQPEQEEEEDRSRLDILDDPVRMYLKSKWARCRFSPATRRWRFPSASRRRQSILLRQIICGFGFAGKEHTALAEKLLCEPPKERFDRVIVDKKVEGRDKHLRGLRKLIKKVRARWIRRWMMHYIQCLNAPRNRSSAAFSALSQGRPENPEELRSAFLFYKQRVIEEMALVAENIRDKIHLSLRVINEWEEKGKACRRTFHSSRPSSARSPRLRGIRAHAAQRLSQCATTN